MKLFRQIFAVVALSILGLTASAQSQTTSNLINSGSGHTWTGVTTGSIPSGCATAGPCPGGPSALYDPNTNTIHFSYGQSTVAQTFAINQALANSGSGIVVQGYNYSWDINNLNYDNRQGSTDTLTARVLTYTPTGELRRSDSWTYNTKFDWTTFAGSVNYNTPGAPSDFGNLRVEFTGMDSGFWGGYFGPQIRNVDVRLRYAVDQCVVNPQSSPSCPGYKTYYNNMWDDGYERVDLPFTFPLYGQNFTTSYMFTNGVVGFLDPNQNSFCCSGINMNQNPGSPWNYAIYGLQTDLGPGHDSRFWSQVGDGGTSMRYGWDRVYDLGTNNASTFNIQIKNTGYIGINYESVNSQYNITAGIAGDISQGEYSQIYHGWGGAFTPNAQYTFTGTEITDQCANNPLWSTTCPGYQQAYLDQQCSYNPLYSNQCSGYAQAYFNQQCNQNTLYDSACPGYAAAYYNYQCSVSALYHTGCPGYEVAYFNQQCGLNPLYNNQCPGYEVAYFNQQCSNDALYSNQCPGYGEAYAKKYILVTSDTVVTETVTPVEEVVTVVEQVESVKEKVEVAVVVAEAPAASASPADKTSPVQLTTAPATSTTTTSTETKKESAPAANSPRPAASAARQALTQRRAAAQAASQQAAAQQASEKINSGEMSTDMDTSTSMEQQVEIQNVVMGAMGFVPGFDAYGKAFIPDAVGYKPFTIYNNQTNVDNARMMRGLTGSSDRLHEVMVDQQYR